MLMRLTHMILYYIICLYAKFYVNCTRTFWLNALFMNYYAKKHFIVRERLHFPHCFIPPTHVLHICLVPLSSWDRENPSRGQLSPQPPGPEQTSHACLSVRFAMQSGHSLSPCRAFRWAMIVQSRGMWRPTPSWASPKVTGHHPCMPLRQSMQA